MLGYVMRSSVTAGRKGQLTAAVARQFCSPRVTHGSRQPAVGGQQAVLPSQVQKVKKAQLVPEVTVEQKQAAAALQTAKREAAAAATFAERATTDAATLKLLYETHAAKKLEAEEAARAAQKAVLDAKAAKSGADKRAVAMIESKRKQDEKFLESAFDHFDTDKKGLLSFNQLQAILADCKLPANGEDVDLLDGIRDRAGWLLHMPAELKAALANHPQAGLDPKAGGSAAPSE